MIVVDTSGSMGAGGMATVRSAVGSFLSQVPADVAVGLTSFADNAVVDVPPTKDRQVLRAALGRLKSAGETTLYDGVVLGARSLASYDNRTMVLLSDGGDTRSTHATAQSAGTTLKDMDIRVEQAGSPPQAGSVNLSGFLAVLQLKAYVP